MNPSEMGEDNDESGMNTGRFQQRNALAAGKGKTAPNDGRQDAKCGRVGRGSGPLPPAHQERTQSQIVKKREREFETSHAESKHAMKGAQ